MNQLNEKDKVDRDEVERIVEQIKRNKGAEENKLKVLVYGTDQLNYENQGRGVAIKSKSYDIYFHHLSNSECPEFTKFDIVIIHAGIFCHSGWKYSYTSELVKRKKQTHEFLKKKHSTACFLLPVSNNPIIQLQKSQYKTIIENDLAVDFLSRSKIYLAKLPNPIDEIRTNRGEFKEFIDKYVVADIYIQRNNESNYHILCSANITGSNDSMVVGIAKNSKIIVLPYHQIKKDTANVNEFYVTLTNCILSYKSKIYLEIPAWLSDYKFDQEGRLISLKNILTESMMSLNDEIGNFDVFKRVIFLGDDDLKDAVRNVISNGLNLNVRDVEEVKEDLSIIDENGQTVALIEIKGLNGNVQRGDVNQVDTHREKNNLSKCFPALLIANTFMTSNSLESKKQEIHPDIIKKATQDRIIIMRTIDLLDVLNLKLTNLIESTDFLEILTSNKYGWLFVEDKKLCVKSE